MGQFDAFKKPIAGGRNAIELPASMTNNGVAMQIAIPMSGPQVSPEEEARRRNGGTTAAGADSGLIAKQIKSDRSKNKVRNAVTRNRGKDAVNVAHEEALQDIANQQKQDILTTSLRKRNGEVVDTEDTMHPTGPATPAPDRSVLSSIEKSTGLNRRSGSIGNSARATGFALGLNPSDAYKDREYDANREDLLSGEAAFNKAERESGSNLRSEGGITYEELQAGTTGDWLKQRSDVRDAAKTTETGIPKPRNAYKGTPDEERPSKEGESTGAVRGGRATLDDALPMHGAKDAWRSAQIAGSGKKGNFDANANAIKPAKDRSEQDLWDKEDNLKPEYNDLDNNPLSTTTMRMRDTAPLFVSKQHKKAFSLRTKAFKEQEERHATELSGADKMSDTEYLATTARHDAERQELKAAHPVPPEGYTLPEGDREIKAVDTGSVAQPYRPQGKKGPRLSARNIINWPTTADMDEGKTMSELEKEDKNVRKNRMRKAGITEVNMNEMSAGAPAAVTPEAKIIKSAKLASRIAAGRGASTNVTRGNPDIIERAARLSKKLAPDLGESDVGHPSHPYFSQSTYASMATVMHHAGVEEDKNGTKDYEQLKKFAGDRSFSDSVETARQYIDNQKRFNSGKQTTYSAKPGVNEEKVNPSTDYFRTKKGEKVSLADMKHPENPLRGGGVMKGSESPFMGFHGDVNSEEGIKPTAKGVIGKSPEWLHQGWHPYTEKETGHRVFEHHDVSGATHMGDLVKHAIKKGRTFNNMTASLTKGSAIRFRAGEDAPLYKVTAAPSEVTTRGRRKGKELASKFGPARAAILAEGRAPLATPEGAGETTLNIRRNGVNTETTEAERTNIASTKADRSEGRFVDMGSGAKSDEARKIFGNNKPKTEE